MLNPFFLQGSKGEQGLLQDLVNEQLKIYGVDVYYLPRQYIKQNTIIEEVIQSEFNNAYPIEAYVDTFDGYDGAGTLLSKFGIQEMDELVLVISKERFENYISPLMKDIEDIKLYTRPKEGDLIYFPLGDRLFEIKYVEHEKPFYQLQKNYVYELRCELFRYEDEVIDTNIEEIDDNLKDIGYIQTLQMVSIGVTATATASIANGSVRYIEIINRGRSYTSPPTVSISKQLTDGISAVGIATLISGICDFCESDENLGRVQAIELINGGSGYAYPPKVVIFGGDGEDAEAKSHIANGVVRSISITNGGSGYVRPPEIALAGTATSTAEVRAIVENGEITSIRIIDGGYGYSSAPSVIIQSPTASGVGTYEYNEIVIGSESGVSARVKSWNVITKYLEVSNLTGEFIEGEMIVGQKSGAAYALFVGSTDNLDDPEDDLNDEDLWAQNRQIQIESDAILDFSEKNPFGTP